MEASTFYLILAYFTVIVLPVAVTLLINYILDYFE
jgi:hypothetical protein